jgi:hypothetical protein
MEKDKTETSQEPTTPLFHLPLAHKKIEELAADLIAERGNKAFSALLFLPNGGGVYKLTRRPPANGLPGASCLEKLPPKAPKHSPADGGTKAALDAAIEAFDLMKGKSFTGKMIMPGGGTYEVIHQARNDAAAAPGVPSAAAAKAPGKGRPPHRQPCRYFHK